jgi:hypothetical protein
MREAEKYVLASHADIKKYAVVTQAGGMSLNKLAQTTHVHLLGFSMLYGLTGLIFSLTSYPGIVRFVIAPWALLMQLADISCWWLARMPSPSGEMFGQAVAFTGGLVALGLFVQVVGSLWDLFGKTGKVVVIALLLAAAALSALLHFQVIEPFLRSEKAAASSVEKTE